MDKKVLEMRLKSLENLKENHTQDIVELDFVIEGLKKIIEKMPNEVEKIEEVQENQEKQI